MDNTIRRDTLQEVKAAVETFFSRDKVKHEPFNERNVASATYSVDARFGHVTIFFHAYEDKIILHFMIPLNAKEEERSKVGEFILRANYGLKVGGFDFDFNDGEVSYRIALYCGDDEFAPPTYEQIDFAVVIGLMMIERYGDALVKVMFGLVEPVDAIAAVEAED
ncbi:MAG: YbjN domain-containing protein [Selenomonadaceae bacterium]|nr:YbjN domain-containing protein [Selenomonadaceae bacterium]